MKRLENFKKLKPDQLLNMTMVKMIFLLLKVKWQKLEIQELMSIPTVHLKLLVLQQGMIPMVLLLIPMVNLNHHQKKLILMEYQKLHLKLMAMVPLKPQLSHMVPQKLHLNLMEDPFQCLCLSMSNQAPSSSHKDPHQ